MVNKLGKVLIFGVIILVVGVFIIFLSTREVEPTFNLSEAEQYSLRIGLAVDNEIRIPDETLEEIKNKLIETTPISQCYVSNIEIIQDEVYNEVLNGNEIHLNEDNKADVIIEIKNQEGDAFYSGKKSYKTGGNYGSITYSYKTFGNELSTRVTIHELGHFFGLADQYCYQQNPINPIFDFEESKCETTKLKYCINLAGVYNSEKVGYCLGNIGILNGRTVMGSSFLSPIQFDINEWNHLREVVDCTYKECIPKKCRSIDKGLKFDGCGEMIECEGGVLSIFRIVEEEFIELEEDDPRSIACLEGHC